MTITDADVRAWGRDQGIEMPTRGKLAPTWHEQFREAHPELEDVDEPEETGEQLPALPAAPVDDQDTGETRPRDPRRPKFSLKRKAAAVRRPKRRVSLESLAGAGWAALAGIAQQSGLGPTGRVLALQAPVAGVIVEDSLKGTLADRIVQPIARAAESGGNLAALFGPPVLVTWLQMHPEQAPRLLPVLEMCLRQWLMVAGPALKKQQAKEAKAAETLGLEQDQGLDDVIKGWIQMIFAEPEPAGMPDGG